MSFSSNAADCLRILTALAVGGSLSGCTPAPRQPESPDTPSLLPVNGSLGSTPLAAFATAWFTTYSAHDSASARRFVSEHPGDIRYNAAQVDSVVLDLLQFHDLLGSLTPVTIIHSSDSSFVVLVRSAKAGAWLAEFKQARQPGTERVTIAVSPAQPLPEMTTATDRVSLVRTASGRPIVMVRINGSAPLRFVIDIGTNVSLITPAAVRLLTGSAPSSDGRFFYDSLQLGETRFRAGRMLLDDLGDELDGLLGLDHFAELLLTLDYPGNAVQLSRDSLPSADGREILAYTLPQPGSPTIPIQLGGHRVDAVLDVGSSMPIAVPDSMVVLLPWLHPPVAGKRRSGPQIADGRGRVGRLIDDAVIGTLTVQQPMVEAVPGLHDEILVGQPLLNAFALTLDQRHRRVRLARTGPANTGAPAVTLPGFRVASAGASRVIDDVVPGSAAARAGARIGDTLRTLQGHATATMSTDEITRALADGQRFTLEVIRAGKP
ncbi:MAG: PDZ domain-containing protein, partial [Gemmatimonadales bacterium]